MSDINLYSGDRYKCYCAREENIDHSNKLNNLTIVNDTRSRACVSQLSSNGIIRQSLICMEPRSSFKLDGKISYNENIKIRTPVTEFYACSGVIKPTDGQTIKVSEVERNRWGIVC
jgi:hypothetical protein